MENPKVKKFYKRKKRIESNNTEIENYLSLLNKRKPNLCVSFPEVEDEFHLYKKSWDNICKKTNESIGYFLRHILFIQQIPTDKNIIDNYKNIIKDDKEFKQIYFESIFNTSKPLDIPFNMDDKDFENYNRFFDRKK